MEEWKMSRPRIGPGRNVQEIKKKKTNILDYKRSEEQ